MTYRVIHTGGRRDFEFRPKGRNDLRPEDQVEVIRFIKTVDFLWSGWIKNNQQST